MNPVGLTDFYHDRLGLLDALTEQLADGLNDGLQLSDMLTDKLSDKLADAVFRSMVDLLAFSALLRTGLTRYCVPQLAHSISSESGTGSGPPQDTQLHFVNSNFIETSPILHLWYNSIMKPIHYILYIIARLYSLWMMWIFARPKFETLIADSAYLSRIDAILFERSVRFVSFITLLRKD
jgi:type II secretory pathway component PulF